VAETFKATNVNTEEEITQHIDEKKIRKPKFRKPTGCRKPGTR